MLGSVSVYGFCSTHLSGKPARYPGLFACGPTKTLSYGISWKNFTQHTCQCQSNERLAHLRRLRSSPDPYRQTALRQRQLRFRIGSSRLRLGFHDDRSMPFSFPLGQVSQKKGSGETPYTPGSPWKHSNGYVHNSRKNPGYYHPRQTLDRTRGDLDHGSRLSGLCPSLYHSPILRVLCHSYQGQLKPRTSLFARSGQVHRGSMRSDCRSFKLLPQKELSGKAKTHSISGCRQKQAPRFYNKQLYLPRFDHCGTVSMSLAG